jgi:isopentenyl-diphosphate Delta-isomerase
VVDELVDIYDENDKYMNMQMMKSVAHAKAMWHRAVHVWIYNSTGQILLQKRSDDLEIYPGCWDITCTGHVRSGEELKSAAHREVLEELGINIDESKLKYVELQKNITSHADKQKGIINTYYHLNHVFLLKYDLSSSDLKFHDGEVQSAKFMFISNIEKLLMTHEDNFTPTKEKWNYMLGIIKKEMLKVHKD